jgi:hypothetical protein
MAFNKTPPTNTPAHEFKMWAHRAACNENMIRKSKRAGMNRHQLYLAMEHCATGLKAKRANLYATHENFLRDSRIRIWMAPKLENAPDRDAS